MHQSIISLPEGRDEFEEERRKDKMKVVVHTTAGREFQSLRAASFPGDILVLGMKRKIRLFGLQVMCLSDLKG